MYNIPPISAELSSNIREYLKARLEERDNADCLRDRDDANRAVETILNFLEYCGIEVDVSRNRYSYDVEKVGRVV